MPALKITDVRAICTAPDGIRLVVVKVETTEPGLYGVGCATFTQRPLTVVTAIEQYLKPFLVGRDPNDIEDIWQASFVSSYWRSGPVLNNAMSGVDQALWDIKGKRAGMPVYQLFGGKARRAADVYVHANGRDFAELEDRARQYVEQGYRYVRCQIQVAGYSTYGTGGSQITPQGAQPMPSYRLTVGQRPWEPRPYCRLVPRMFEHLRGALGEEVELLHDIHERVPPIMAIQLAKDLEPYKLFFLEDVFAPEDNDYFRLLRQQTSVPIAMGELYVNQHEYIPLIRDRLIDFIRVHISDIGGLTPARKLAAFCELFGVRTAWHGPGDVSPVGHAANLQLDLACHNFGIQEAHLFGERAREVFPGCPDIHDGAMWSNEQPGLGIDVDETQAAKYPFPEHPLNGAWPEIRRADGTVIRP
ncbi:MAG: starvation-sensing protein RspA [Chloroflexi bacterium]|nr:starvation-sensing protein RspA [Chloroflexota bacterium]